MPNKTKQINPAWRETLKYLAGMISKEKAVELVQDVSEDYFKAKKEYEKPRPALPHSEPWKGDWFDELMLGECVRPFRLVCEIAAEANLSIHQLPSVIRQEWHKDGIIWEYFWRSGGSAQTFVFRNLPHRTKEGIVNQIVKDIYRNDKEKWNRSLSHGFKFDWGGVELIIKTLTKSQEYYSHPSKIVPAEERPFMLAGDLSKHLEKNQETLDLWFNYFNSNLPNKVYAAEILAELGDSRVIKPLAEMLRQPITNPFKGIAPYCWGYENYIKEPIAESLLKMGEAVLPSLMELIKSGEWKGRNEAIWILREMKYKGSQPADTLLHELLPEKEYRKWCKPKKSKK